MLRIQIRNFLILLFAASSITASSHCLAEEISNKSQFEKAFRSTSKEVKELQCREIGKALDKTLDKTNSEPQSSQVPESKAQPKSACTNDKLSKSSAQIIQSLKKAYPQISSEIYDDFSVFFKDLKKMEFEELASYLPEVQKLAKKQKGKTCGLTLMELLCLRAYTLEFYRPVNKALRSGDIKDVARFSNYIQLLNSALDKLAAYNGIVRRGAVLPNAVLSGYQEGKMVTEKGYLSTSINDTFWGEHLFIIQSKHCRYIAPLSAHFEEYEVLCKPNTQFKVKKKFDGLSIGNGSTGFVLEEIDQ